MKSFIQWFRNKFGRITTACGGLLALADLDVSPIKDNLEGLIGHKGVQGLLTMLFIASFLRHHWVSTLHPPT